MALITTFSPLSLMRRSFQATRTWRSPTPRKPPTPRITLSTLPSALMYTDSISPTVSSCGFLTLRPISFLASAPDGMAATWGSAARGGVVAC